MFKTVLTAAATAFVFIMAVPAEASHSSVSIMSPRNTVHIDKDYSYGYQYLPGDALDVYETPNRVIGWNVNYVFLDKYFLRPVSVAYRTWVYEGIRDCIYNMNQNIREVNNTVNNALIGEFGDSCVSAARLLINSTIGVLGCFDAASHMGLSRHRMTMNTVLGRWGVENGPYVVIPVVGIGTARSYTGDVIDTLYFPFTYFPWWADMIFWATNGVDSRSRMLNQDEILANSMDPYLQARDFYLMYSQSCVTGDKSGISGMGDDKASGDKNIDDYMNEIDE